MPTPVEDATEVQEEVKEPKRGRGRPKKVAKAQDDKQASGPPAKRGRPTKAVAAAATKKPGKAKKVAEPEPEDEGDSASAENDSEESEPERAPVPAKRGRGRPPGKASAAKKTTKESKKNETEPESAIPAKKGRGKKTAPRNGHTEDEDVKQAADEDAEENSNEDAEVDSNEDAEEAVKEDADDDEDSDSTPTEQQSDAKIKLIVEHCKSCHTYRNRADEILSAVRAKWPNLEVEFNPKGQRKGAFEFNLVRDDGSDVNIYSGVNLGPPRKNKFPDPDVVVRALEKACVPE